MEGYELPGYTLEEAMEKLELNHSEIKHEIHSGNLTCVAYMAGRSMLIFTAYQQGWTGHGQCTYRGHMSLHQSTISMLVDGDTISVGQGYGTLLDEDGISYWNSDYPFQSPTPHGPLIQWDNCDLDRLPLGRVRATPYPREHKAGHKVVEGLLKQISVGFDVPVDQADLDKLNPGKAANDHTLDFKKNSSIDPGALRIPKSEIERFSDKQKTQRETDKVLETIKEVTQKKPQQRENQLHSLIELILKAEPKITAKRVWAMIENDANSDDPVFDKDGILINVDAECIEWKSRYGTEQALSWGSFQPLLTKLKRSSLKSKLTASL